MPTPLDLLLGSFHAALDAVSAKHVVPPHLPEADRPLIVVGAGKAAAAMAASVEKHWPEHAPLSGLVVTRHGHSVATRRIAVVEAGHPLPEAVNPIAARRVLECLATARPDDRVLALFSGGGSSLLTLPDADLELSDIQTATSALLRSGAPISAINQVRKHLSRTLGGKLAATCAAPARVLLISDVVGDDVSVIASGPFAPDPSTYAEAIEVLSQWSVDAPPAVLRHLRQGVMGAIAETPKPGDPCFRQVETRVVARAGDALAAGQDYFRRQGIETRILGEDFEDEARVLGQAHADLALAARAEHRSRPLALLSGGETRVRVSGNGRGGRNSEYLLSLALHLRGAAGIHALAADTDGIDGTEDNAGAWHAPEHTELARKHGMDASAYLRRNDAWGYFSTLGALMRTGPTRTNVNDYRAILIA